MKRLRLRIQVKNFLGNMSISKKLITVMLGLTGLFAAILTGYYYTVSAEVIRINAEGQIVNTLNQAVNNLDSNISTVESILYDTSTNAPLQELLRRANRLENISDYSFWETSENIRNLLMVEATKLSSIQGFYLVDTYGRTYSVKNLRFNFNIKDIDWTRLDTAKGKSVWYGPQYGTASFGKADAPSVIPVGKAVYSLTTQKIVGYLVVFLDTHYLRSIVEDIVFSEDDVIFLVNEEGGTLPENISDSAKQLPFPQKKFASVNYAGGKKRIALWPTSTHVFNLMVITEDEAQNHELNRLQKMTILLLVGIGFLAVLLSILLAQSITKPILNLVQDMQRFSQGDFTVQASVVYKDEIGILRSNFNKLVNNINHLVHDVYNEKMLKQHAQLRMLQMQINPHFLYNTLDTINWLAQAYHASDVAEVSQSLGYLMRFSLAEEELIPLEEEMDAVEHYMRIQHYRYGSQLKAEIQMAEETLYEKVPRHVILPLIENAVEHGLKNKFGEKYVRISSRMYKDNIYIKVSDNGIGMTKKQIANALYETNLGVETIQSENSHMSIGLRNVNERIRLRYGEIYGLRIYSIKGKGTTVLVHFPCQKDSFDRNSQNIEEEV